ncbi:MAG: pantoate--beta-alanine ligase [Candidatus Omnitrophota bacterium]|nr:pantoate--beta-alanine ligase [Candidatus Omnitrophota bacterium]
MKLVDSVSRMSALARMYRKEGKSIGFVPTMGALHEGHLSLIRTAKKHTDIVVVSMFINPIQFAQFEDFDKYPKDIKRDGELARTAGADIIFYPSIKEMYPDDYSTYVNVEGLTDTLCGASRPGHFKGVATVVAKLFGMVKPEIAYFGQKDAQQVIVLKKMVEDLNMGIEIKVLPIVRQVDGLAMSSRNAYLSEGERRDAVVLYRSLEKAEGLIRYGERDSKKIIKIMTEMIRQVPGARIDYVSVVDTKDLKDMDKISQEALIALAVYIGKTRLIDNVIVKGVIV